MTVYQDQIWNKSGCRNQERSAIRQIQDAGGQPYLVDAVDVTYPWSCLVTDNIVSIPHIPLYPEYWGTYSFDPVYIDRQPTKLFNCFINRVCTFRQSWFYQFVRRDLLDFGNISFLLDARSPPRGIDLYKSNFCGNEIFKVEHFQMQDKVPFINFAGDIDQAIVDSQFSLVIETYFDRPGCIAYSEKIFRALQYPRPFIMFNMPGSVKALRDYGFDVYDDVIDHSYDNELNEVQRQILILDLLCSLKEQQFTKEQLVDFNRRAVYNKTLLKDLRLKWPEKLKTAISQIPNK